MLPEKTDAIVIRSVDFSETSSVVTFFTRDFGKLTVLAKGARRKKSPFESALDLLATCRIVFLHKSSDALDLLTEAKLSNRLRAGEAGLPRLYAAYYIAELLQNLMDELDPHPELWEATERSLRLIENPTEELEPVILHYELFLLREAGLFPSLDTCVGCGQPIPPGARVSFGLIAGGVLCGNCRSGHRQLVSVRREIVEILKNFSDPDPSRWRNHSGYHQLEKEIRPLMNRFLAALMGKQPRMKGYLRIL